MTTSAHSKSFTEASTSRDAALALVEAVRAASEQIGFGAAIAVTDHGGHLRAFERSDETPFLAGTVATDKAWTASSYRIVTHQWNAYLADPEVAPLGRSIASSPSAAGTRSSSTARYSAALASRAATSHRTSRPPRPRSPRRGSTRPLDRPRGTAGGVVSARRRRERAASCA